MRAHAEDAARRPLRAPAVGTTVNWDRASTGRYGVAMTLSLRDEMAVRIAAALATANALSPSAVARRAYATADALIAARAPGGTQLELFPAAASPLVPDPTSAEDDPFDGPTELIWTHENGIRPDARVPEAEPRDALAAIDPGPAVAPAWEVTPRWSVADRDALAQARREAGLQSGPGLASGRPTDADAAPVDASPGERLGRRPSSSSGPEADTG